MNLIRRSAPKGVKAYLSVKGAKKAAKLIPTRLLAALGAVAAAGLAATVAKRRSSSTTSTTGAVPAPTPPPADPDEAAAHYTETQKTGV